MFNFIVLTIDATGGVHIILWGAGMAQWLCILPPTHVSHQCGPGSIPGLGVKCGLSLLLVLVLAPRGFSLGTPVFPSIWNSRATGLSVVLLVSRIVKCHPRYIN